MECINSSDQLNSMTDHAFMLGCNYWASHAGADMWRQWDAGVVESDIALLAAQGVNTLRVFPNWRDFQPAEPLYGGKGALREYRMAGDGYPTNPYFLDEAMLARFGFLCEIAQKHHIRLIVGLVTGWMSGRLYVPPALFGKNLFTDPAALHLQQLFIQGFVGRFKGVPCICAWDLGNECNEMSAAQTRHEALCWTLTVTNAIRAADPSRPVISGMHSLEIEGIWNIQDQGFCTDMLTTHPYPFWVEHCMVDPLHATRTLLHATAQTQYYGDVGRKPCLVEEIGSMGPMIACEEITAGFLRVNLFSNWTHGATGLLWWCANEQSHLDAPPYDWNMCERELGMLDKNREPKPMLREMRRFAQLVQTLGVSLPPHRRDGVCVLTQGQDHWGVAYMTYLLAKQAGLTLGFAYCEQELPENGLYLLPSITGPVMNKAAYDRLKRRVQDGATLYLSIDDGMLTEFEELMGLRVEYARKARRQGRLTLPDGGAVEYHKRYHVALQATRAEVLARDEEGLPLLTQAEYGKGRVLLSNVPWEAMLLDMPDCTLQSYHQVYRKLFDGNLAAKTIRSGNPCVGVTEHGEGEERIAVLINYSSAAQDTALHIKSTFAISKVLYGNAQALAPYDACILALGMVR